jgi:transcriptional regulator with GAF, ATPase, and Fis domain
MDTEFDEDAMGNLNTALLKTESVEQFLHELAELAASLITGGLSCAVTLRPNGRPVTAACSDDLAARADEAQYRADEGPCLHAMRDGQMVRIDDTANYSRWPQFEAKAMALGIRSCLALPLSADDQTLGALNLYARSTAAFGLAETRRAEGFARNASGALALAHRLASYAALTEQLRSSISSRSVIDQALGIIMIRQRCNQEQAFEVLRTTSQNRNIKLRDLAISIITSVSGEPPGRTRPFEEDRSFLVPRAVSCPGG